MFSFFKINTSKNIKNDHVQVDPLPNIVDQPVMQVTPEEIEEITQRMLEEEKKKKKP